jgi:putative hydrolase of the HAD superfamily
MGDGEPMTEDNHPSPAFCSPSSLDCIMFDVIAFDADDTLWHNEHLFTLTEAKFAQLLAPYQHEERVKRELFSTETRNLEYFGYGIKGFTLAMIETAIELTDGEIHGKDLQQIIQYAKEMLSSPIELLEHVRDTISALAASYPLMIITKGDLLDQESKIARSGLAEYFTHIEIVSDKTAQIYAACLAKYKVASQKFLMVGNSLKSDVLPVLELGGNAVYIPYRTTWAHEVVANPPQAGYYTLEHIGQLPALIEQL